jgi:hypothetical protein
MLTRPLCTRDRAEVRITLVDVPEFLAAFVVSAACILGIRRFPSVIDEQSTVQSHKEIRALT